MKKTFTSVLFFVLSFHLKLKRGNCKNIIVTRRRIIILFFVLASSLNAQNIIDPNAPDAYKNVYVWKEKENYSPTNDSILTVLGRWAWGLCAAVDVDSNFAYIGNGPTFHVLNISNPSNPKIYGEYLTEGFIYDIEVRDNVAFVCIGGGLLLLDVSDPSLPGEISFIGISGVAISLALVDSFAYVTTISGSMWVIDISDIYNPCRRGGIAAGGGFAFCVEAKDSYVYIGTPEIPMMVIVDATNPDSLSRIDFDVGGAGLSAFIKDTLLFIGAGNDLKIYDVSNASLPAFVGQVETYPPELIMATTVSEDGHVAFIRTLFGNTYSVNISDLTQPVIIDGFKKEIGKSIGYTGISSSRNTLYVAYDVGLLAFDVSEPDSLRLQSFFPTGGLAEKIYLQDTLALVASGLSGLWILDVSNPEKPVAISNVNTGSFTADLVVEDTLAYIVNWAVYSEQDTSRGLWIIDISDINKPIIISHYIGINQSSSGVPNSITKSNNIILITQEPTINNTDILEIIDISNPFAPTQLGVFQSNYIPHNTAVKDSIVFLSTSDGGLRVLNIINPSNPVEVDVFQNSTFLVGIFVMDNFAFADRIDTLFVLDIDSPTTPKVLGKMGRNFGSFSSIDLFAYDDFLYWAEGNLGVVDVSDKKNPREIALFSGKDLGRGVTAVYDKIFFADQSQGVWILKNNLITYVEERDPDIFPNQFELKQNYPNPFNPRTIIEFFVPRKGLILIEVFDLLGQLVQTLVDKEMEAGKHRTKFDAGGLSSGIYFYRMITKEISVTKKMVILR